MTTRAQYIRSLFPQDEHQGSDYYYPSYPTYPSPPSSHHSYYGEYPQQYGGSDYGREEEVGGDPREAKYLEMELRRKNPDLLDKLRFAMTDKQYGKLVALLAKGAFFGAAMYGLPFLAVPFGIGALVNSRQKQLSRQQMGLKPRYQFIHKLRPEDRY